MIKKIKNKKYSILQMFLKYSFVVVFAFFLVANSTIALDGSIDGNVTVNTKIENPLGEDLTDINSFIAKVLEVVAYVGVPIITLAIIYSGFLFVTAQGNSEKLGKAKKALLYSIIGAALLLGAWILAESIGETVDDIKSTT